SSVLITISVLTFIWAVNTGAVVEVSLGYFITPLLTIFMGVVLMRERLRPLQWISIGIAVFGLLYLTIDVGSLPWVALVLGSSFVLYTLVKKMAPLSSLTGQP
ncbi:MAG: EamA family transporter, partial [Thermoleophilia bacterium]